VAIYPGLRFAPAFSECGLPDVLGQENHKEAEMSKQRSLSALIREHKTPFLLILVGLFLIELEIFALAALKSGRQSWLQVIDKHGSVIYETDGDNLSDFNKYYFEKTFGPFENYDVRLRTEERPFPFRAWFVAAVGIPVGLILLFGFLVKAYAALFLEEDDASESADRQEGVQGRLEQVLHRIGRFNIFTIGFLIFLAVFAYWVVPNTLAYIGKVGIETLTRYKWVVLGICAAFLALAVWIIYLRYLLAKKSIEARAEVDKHRLELEYAQNQPDRARIGYDEPPSVATWPNKEDPEGEPEELKP
jgi:hypothetical protein